MIAAATTKPAKRFALRDLVLMLLPAVILYVAASATIETIHVVGYSMMPTLSNGDLLVASKVDYRLHAPERGDIVILQNPGVPTEDYVKRIVGLPGDRVLIHDAHVYINGSELDEPYVSQPWTLTRSWPQSAIDADGETVPGNAYFVLGDNRDHSRDSRSFGFVTRDEIEAKVLLRFWPAGAAGTVGPRPSFSNA